VQLAVVWFRWRGWTKADTSQSSSVGAIAFSTNAWAMKRS